MSRIINVRYRDPLDEIWLATARALGLAIARSEDVFAATDGEGELTLGSPHSLDPDDCLGQMVFHELCHSLVQGPQSFTEPDWGLDNLGDGDAEREHACLRVQAVLARRWGLERIFGPTTDFRAYYDALGDNPLAGADPSVELAKVALEHAKGPPWQPHLERALAATRAMALVLEPFAPPDSLWARLSPAREPE